MPNRSQISVFTSPVCADHRKWLTLAVQPSRTVNGLAG